MKSIFKVLYVGLSISFLGSMVLGMINMAAMQISITEGIRPALFFSSGCILAEVLYVRVLLVALSWIRKQEYIFKILGWLVVLKLGFGVDLSEQKPFSSDIRFYDKRILKASFCNTLNNTFKIFAGLDEGGSGITAFRKLFIYIHFGFSLEATEWNSRIGSRKKPKRTRPDHIPDPKG